jgi:hypothetical protein
MGKLKQQINVGHGISLRLGAQPSQENRNTGKRLGHGQIGGAKNCVRASLCGSLNGTWCKISLSLMKELHRFPIAPGRKIGAWVCLIAALLLWSPLWAVAWQAHGMDCCTDGMCAAHGHTNSAPHHPRHSPSPAIPTNCEHSNETELMQCSISCCPESENTHSVTTAITFVLPYPLFVAEPTVTPNSAFPHTPPEFVQSFKPPSPPPRSSLFAS